MNPANKWVKDRPNILSPENIEKIKTALNNGCIFGHHYHYYGGSSFTIWAYSGFDSFMDHISRSKPGDLYVVWSTTQLVQKKMTLIWGKYDDKSDVGAQLISKTQMQTLETYLDKNRYEIIAVFQLQDKTDARMYEKDELIDFIELLTDYNQPASEIFVFPMKDIDIKDHILVEAKYPNENGEIPIGGAY